MSGCAANDPPNAIISPQRFAIRSTVRRIQNEYIETIGIDSRTAPNATCIVAIALGTAPHFLCAHTLTQGPSLNRRQRNVDSCLLVVAIENELFLDSCSVCRGTNISSIGTHAAVASMRLYTTLRECAIKSSLGCGAPKTYSIAKFVWIFVLSANFFHVHMIFSQLSHTKHMRTSCHLTISV